MKNNEVNVVDVRAAEDFSEGHIPGAINLPKDQWHALKGLRKDKTNVLYCYSQVCHLAASAALEFAAKGYPVMELEGGWRWWKDDGFQIQNEITGGGFRSTKTVWKMSVWMRTPGR